MSKVDDEAQFRKGLSLEEGSSPSLELVKWEVLMVCDDTVLALKRTAETVSASKESPGLLAPLTH